MRALLLVALVACSSANKHDAAARELLKRVRGTTVFDGYVPSPKVGGGGLFAVRPHSECEVAILPNGEDSFGARMDLLARAKQSIRIQALIYTGDESGLRVAEVLKQKKREGLDVKVIVDAVNNLAPQTQWMYFDLKQHGVEIEGYEALGLTVVNEIPIPFLTPRNDPAHPNKRYHEKLWIIDAGTPNAEAVTGGLNIANEYFRVDPANVPRYWRDQDVLVRGAILEDLTATFDRNWQHFREQRTTGAAEAAWKAARAITNNSTMDVKFTRRDDLAKVVAALEARPFPREYQGARCRFLQARPRLEETYIQQAYLKLLDAAKTEVLIANAYFIPTPSFLMAFEEAAARCVRVVLLSNGAETNDTPGMNLLSRGYYAKLLAMNKPHCKTGIEVWEWMGKRADEPKQTQGLLHAKYAVADRTISIVGSYNLDPRSERLNSESAIVFESAPLGAELEKLFRGDLVTSRRISKEEAATFEKADSVRARLKNEFAKLFESQL